MQSACRMVATSELDMWRVASTCIRKLLRTAFSSSDEYARRLIALEHRSAGLTVQLVCRLALARSSKTRRSLTRCQQACFAVLSHQASHLWYVYKCAAKPHVFSLLAMIVDIGLSDQPDQCTCETTRVPMNMIHVDCNNLRGRARDTCVMDPPHVPLCGWEPQV